MSRNRILILAGLFGVIVVGVVILIVVPKPSQTPEQKLLEKNSGHAGASLGAGGEEFSREKVSAEALSDLIIVSAPTENSAISSPLTITGRARGTWYFEASAPVELLDARGNVIAQNHITAQGDPAKNGGAGWMTTEFVPFTATLTFTKPATATGTLVLKNDNPSGDPSRQKELDIPVKF